MTDFGLEDELRGATRVFATCGKWMTLGADHQHKANKVNAVSLKSLEKIVVELRKAFPGAAVLALLDIIGELRWGSFGLVCFLSICSGLSAWTAWWLWP